MSPTEHELRAALHQGEGDRIDPESVIASARIARRRRLTQLASMGAVVVAAASLAVGIGVLGRDRTSTNDGAVAQLPRTPVPNSHVNDYACPTIPPAVDFPTSSVRQGALFPDALTSMTICVYRSTLETPPNSLVSTRSLNAAQARSLAAEFNAPTARSGQLCPGTEGRTVIFRPVTASGPIPDVLGSTTGCGIITNGRAARDGGPLLRSLVDGPGSGSGSGRASHGPGPS